MVRRFVVQLSSVSIVLVAVAACGTAASGEPDSGVDPDVTASSDPQIVVVVDVMSGVPNPTWTVTGSAASQLVDLLHSLPDTGKGDATQSLQLGFRGFVLTGDGLTADAGLDQVRVLGSEIIATKPNKFTGRTLTDADQSVYTLLRTMAGAHLDENVLQAIPLEGLKGSP